jgi:proteasome lid subunit RPN8/RPN11
VTLLLPASLAHEIRRLGEAAYPEEGAGLLIGVLEDGDLRRVVRAHPLDNRWQDSDRARRYQIEPLDLVAAEEAAERDGLLVLGVFHSHPDHPARPSAFDLERALPFYSYLITRVTAGEGAEMHAWRLSDDGSRFSEEEIRTTESQEAR